MLFGSHLCARSLSAPGWWWNKCSYSSIRHSHWTRVNALSTLFIHRCCCNVLGSQNAHPSTETYIGRTLFVLGVIYNKPYYRCIVRFKLYHGPSACRTACGELYGKKKFQRTDPPLIYICICMYMCCQDCIKILQNTFFSQGRKSYGFGMSWGERKRWQFSFLGSQFL